MITPENTIDSFNQSLEKDNELLNNLRGNIMEQTTKTMHILENSLLDDMPVVSKRNRKVQSSTNAISNMFTSSKDIKKIPNDILPKVKPRKYSNKLQKSDDTHIVLSTIFGTSKLTKEPKKIASETLNVPDLTLRKFKGSRYSQLNVTEKLPEPIKVYLPSTEPLPVTNIPNSIEDTSVSGKIPYLKELKEFSSKVIKTLENSS